MILLLDSDPDRLADVSAGLIDTGQAVLGLNRADVAARVMDRAGTALVVLSDMVAGWRQLVGKGEAPVLVVSSDPGCPGAEGAAAAMGAGLGSGPILQMARALLTGSGAMTVAPAGPGARDEEGTAATRPAAASTPERAGIVTDPALPDAGDGEEGAAPAWRGIGQLAARLAAAQDKAAREAARTDAAAAADYARQIAEARRRAVARPDAGPAEDGDAGPEREAGEEAERTVPAGSPLKEVASLERLETPAPDPVQPLAAEASTPADAATPAPPPIAEIAADPASGAIAEVPHVPLPGEAALPVHRDASTRPASVDSVSPPIAATLRQAAKEAFSAALAASAAARQSPAPHPGPAVTGRSASAPPSPPHLARTEDAPRAGEARREAQAQNLSAQSPRSAPEPALPAPVRAAAPASPPPPARQLRPATLVEFGGGQLVPVAPDRSAEIHPARRIGGAGGGQRRGAA